ncbi:putative glycoside hydrolase family 15 protein [Opitutaceae bacterium]|nr:putative glycoside hydrolase family 15 protein [Opitutaceae bacterium]
MRTKTSFALAVLFFTATCWAAESDPTSPSIAELTGFSWDKVPLNIHFGKRTSDMTDAEIEFVAKHGNLVALEKGHGASAHGSTEAGSVDTARRIKAKNPKVKVLFYLNSFINYPGYESYATYRDEWTLRDITGNKVIKIRDITRPDPSNPEFREWWSDVVAATMERGPLDGVFVDALPQALGPTLAEQVGPEKARAVIAGLEEMLAMTKRKIGPDRILIANGTRSTNYREILDWEGIDGVMIEHFDAINTTDPTDLKADLETIALAAAKGKFVSIKGWPGFTFIDKEAMSMPHEKKLRLARGRITFPLACFLAAVQPGSVFCYSWGYTHPDGMLESYPELEHPLGPPKSDAVWDGLTATREFAHARVWVNLATKEARIDWR